MTVVTDIAFAVLPLRFSERSDAMDAFLRLLGMAPVVTAPGGGFAVLVAGGGGRVMVHGVDSAQSGPAAGTTDLCLATEDTDRAAAALRAAGRQVRVWDESYGRKGALLGAAGEEIALNETQRDLYGYEGHDGADADPRLTVVAVRPTDDIEADVASFAALGFVPRGDAAPGWCPVQGAAGTGIIGLHRPAPGEQCSRDTGSEFGRAAAARIGFETSEDLGRLAARLRDAGHPVELREGGGAGALHVADPDGVVVEIHPAPGR